MNQPSKGPSNKAMKVFESRGFNHPNSKQLADDIRVKCAELYDLFDAIPTTPGLSEAGRLVNIAKTELETSSMMAIKALSRT